MHCFNVKIQPPVHALWHILLSFVKPDDPHIYILTPKWQNRLQFPRRTCVPNPNFLRLFILGMTQTDGQMDRQRDRRSGPILNAHCLMWRCVIRFATKSGDENNSIKHRCRGATIERDGQPLNPHADEELCWEAGGRRGNWLETIGGNRNRDTKTTTTRNESVNTDCRRPDCYNAATLISRSGDQSGRSNMEERNSSSWCQEQIKLVSCNEKPRWTPTIRRSFHRSFHFISFVLHQLLPPAKNPNYSLRERSHNLTIPNDISVVKRRNFIYRMLFTDIYWPVMTVRCNYYS